jgi:putative DNA primase/helicase
VICNSEVFDALLPPPEEDEHIELRVKLRSGGVIQRWSRSIAELTETAEPLIAHADVWFGPALRHGHYGDAGHVTRLQALWCDVDAKCFGGDKSRAYQAVQQVELPPTAVIDSGGGFHGYWVLTAPIFAPQIGTLARGVMRGLRFSVEHHASVLLDHVDDLARVLRLSGSVNQKYTPPRPVTVADFQPSRRYELGDFVSAGLVEPLQQPSACAAVRVRPLVPSRPLPAWVKDALASPDRFVRQSRSELDFAVVCRLVDALGPDEAEAVWSTSALGAREKVQQRPDYRQRTIDAAIRASVPEKSVPLTRLRIKVR